MTTGRTPVPSMAATSLKISEELKRRIERVAASAHETPHAFMLEGLARETEERELILSRRRYGYLA